MALVCDITKFSVLQCHPRLPSARYGIKAAAQMQERFAGGGAIGWKHHALPRFV